MNVRPATPSDCDAIAALHASSWRSTYRHILSAAYLDHAVVEDRHDLWAARFTQFDEAKHHVAVAVDEGGDAGDAGDAAMLGFVCVLLDEEPEFGALIDNLHVAPSRHGAGIGRRLMARAAHWVSTMRPDWPIHLWVYEQNLRTVAFYRRTGGASVDERVIVTPAGNRATVLRFEWREPARLATSLDASLESA